MNGRTVLAIHTAPAPEYGTTKLGFDPDMATCCFPARPFYVELPSGLRHTFESERDARNSQYWPRVAS
jgi:hypothetical protein